MLPMNTTVLMIRTALQDTVNHVPFVLLASMAMKHDDETSSSQLPLLLRTFAVRSPARVTFHGMLLSCQRRLVSLLFDNQVP